MKVHFIALALAILYPVSASSQCDDLVDTILTKHLGPVIADLDCPTSALNKKDHKLNGICYQSAGATSHIRIDTTLRCHASCASFTSKMTGCDNAASISENVAAEATIKGADCSIVDIAVKPSGEVGKVLARWFDVDGKARAALEQGLAEVCRRN